MSESTAQPSDSRGCATLFRGFAFFSDVRVEAIKLLRCPVAREQEHIFFGWLSFKGSLPEKPKIRKKGHRGLHALCLFGYPILPWLRFLHFMCHWHTQRIAITEVSSC